MSRSRKILACLIGLSATTQVYSQETTDRRSVQVIDPNKPVVSVQAAAIDTERFELGAFAGMLSIEDFNSNPVTGLSFSYHINRKFLAQVNYGISSVGRAAFEDVAGGNFLSDDDYDFEYMSLLAGYNLLDGRSFLGKRHKFNSAIYLLAGAADVDFAGNGNTGIVAGVSYRTVLTDWLTFNIDFRDIIVKREFLDDNKQTHNTELTIGVNALF